MCACACVCACSTLPCTSKPLDGISWILVGVPGVVLGVTNKFSHGVWGRGDDTNDLCERVPCSTTTPCERVCYKSLGFTVLSWYICMKTSENAKLLGQFTYVFCILGTPKPLDKISWKVLVVLYYSGCDGNVPLSWDGHLQLKFFTFMLKWGIIRRSRWFIRTC